MRGDWQDFVHYPDGRVVPLNAGQNLIVSTAYSVLAMALKGDPEPLYWAVGDGGVSDSAEWDSGVTSGEIRARSTDRKLARETFRKEIAPENITFIDTLGNPSLTPTNRLRIRSVYLEHEPSDTENYLLREWAIFKGSVMLNRKVHTTYEKTNVTQLERILQLTL